MKTGIELIAEERARQIAVEEYTASDDDAYTEDELTRAAVAYAVDSARGTNADGSDFWPWDIEYFKPRVCNAIDDKIRNLQKAGALIAAEIDRLQRLKQPEQHDA